MECIQCRKYFEEVKPGLRLTHSLDSFKQVEQLTTAAVLESYADLSLGLYGIVHLCDKWMTDFGEDLLFIFHNHLFFVLDQEFLVDNFKSNVQAIHFSQEHP